jgi:WS/DGAT/MGAT family acyltransferase
MPDYAFDRLSVVDNSFLAIEDPNSHQHVGAVTLFEAGPLRAADGGIDIDRVREYVAARLHLIPRYRQRLVRVPLGTRLVWVDDDHFNIDYHVRHTSLPRPGDERQLKRLAARIVSQGLDRAKPLWEIWIVEGLADGRFALVAKTHHCMIDGISGVDLMAVLMSPSPDEAIPAAPTWLPRPAPSRFALLRDEWLRRFSEPLAALRETPCALTSPLTVASHTLENVRALMETLGSTLWPASPTPFNRPIGPHRRFDWTSMELAAVKAVKDRLGGTVNDVVLATVAGALRRFFERRRINPDMLEIRANVPVSLRTAEERGTLGNRIALWMTDLPVSERDPLRRLQAVRATTTRLKESKQAMGAEVLAAVSEWTSSTLLALAVQLATRSRPFNLVVTNVPGPQIPLYLLGAPLQECYPMVNLLLNQGLGVALFSYAGRLCWGCISDWDLVPDLHDFIGDIEASFAELEGIAAMRSRASTG